MNNFTASHHYALHVTFIDFRSHNRMLQKRLTKIMGSFRMARCGGGEKSTSPLQSAQTAGWKLKMKWLVNFLTNKLWIIQCSSTFGVCGWNPMLPQFTVWRFYPIVTPLKWNLLSSTLRRYYLLPGRLVKNAPATGAIAGYFKVFVAWKFLEKGGKIDY